MRRHPYLVLVVLTTALLVAGCADDTSNAPSNGGTGGSGASGAGAGGSGGGGAGAGGMTGNAGTAGVSAGAAGEGGGGSAAAGGAAGEGGEPADAGDDGGMCPVLGCGEHGDCVDDGCFCEPGYVGADCSSCAPGYVVDGDECVAAPAGDWVVDQWGTSAVDAVAALAFVDDGVWVAGRTEGDLEGETSAGGPDLFSGLRARAAPQRWTLQWGSAGIDEAKALAVDAAGNAYVAGNTTGDIDGANLGSRTRCSARSRLHMRSTGRRSGVPIAAIE